jgi:serine/threonine-protein kinase
MGGPVSETGLGFQLAEAEPPRHIDRYEVISLIGKGGMGSVYRARDQKLDRLVAIKLSPRRPGAGDLRWQRFRREAMAVARLDHPNIVKIYDVGELDDAQYLVLELVDGGSLREWLAEGPLAPDDAARLVIKLADAVDFAHSQGIIHRDLKPANILLTADRVPKISDFGLAKFVDGPEPMLGMEAPDPGTDHEDETLTFSGEILGTPTYMAPEQTMGLSSDIGLAADIFSLGVILYEALTGRRPFTGMSVHDVVEAVRHRDPVGPDQLRAEVPAALGAICARCLAKQPAGRYPSARALANDLARFLRRDPLRAGRRRRWLRWPWQPS